MLNHFHFPNLWKFYCSVQDLLRNHRKLWGPCCNWFLREIHHYRTQKSQHFFCTVLLEQKSVVLLNSPIIITVSLVIILESYWYLLLLNQYYYYTYYYAQTSQFAHTTVEGIMRGMLNFIYIHSKGLFIMFQQSF